MTAEIDLALICHKGPAIEAVFDKILQLQKDATETEKKPGNRSKADPGPEAQISGKG